MLLNGDQKLEKKKASRLCIAISVTWKVHMCVCVHVCVCMCGVTKNNSNKPWKTMTKKGRKEKKNGVKSRCSCALLSPHIGRAHTKRFAIAIVVIIIRRHRPKHMLRNRTTTKNMDSHAWTSLWRRRRESKVISEFERQRSRLDHTKKTALCSTRRLGSIT